MRTFYGRSKAGERANCPTTAVRSRNYSIIASMGVDCIFYFSVNLGAINGDAFSAYMQELLQYISSIDDSQAFVIMDNASIHRTQAIQNIFDGYSAIEPIYLPPYTPQLNPIEHLFSQWKGKVRRSSPNNEAELANAIHTTSQSITEENCRSYYQKMESNIFKLLAGQQLDD